MAKRTVAGNIVDHLVAAGVKRVYGVVGDSLNGIVNEIRLNPQVQWVGVRHEEVGIAAQNIEKTRADLALARKQLARIAKLAADGYASKQQLERGQEMFGALALSTAQQTIRIWSAEKTAKKGDRSDSPSATI